MNLKLKERIQKYWTTVIGEHSLSMICRFMMYIWGVGLGVYFLQLNPPLLYLLPEELFKDNTVFRSAIAILILTFPSVTINWLIKNFDASYQLEYSRQQKNETLFSNSLQLLFKENDIIANSIGLKGLVKLKQEKKIDSERVDFITSSGLKIKKAVLQNANLQRVNLQRVNLQGADLIGVDLIEANLLGAKLQKANFIGAYLMGAKLQKANFIEANLIGANLQGADLLGADLRGADLRGADLRRADLRRADLQGANLLGANLQGANLQGANLLGAKLQGAKLKYSYYDEETELPDGLDPDEYKMIKFKLT